MPTTRAAMLKQQPHGQNNHDSSNSSWQDLSKELLLQILQRVRQGQRVGRCTLVCRTWAAAAKEATTHVTLGPHLKAAQLEKGLAWVRQHAGQLQSVVVRWEAESTCWLPTVVVNWAQLSSLTQLELEGVKLSNYNPPAPGSNSSSSDEEDGSRLPSEPHPLLPHLQQLKLTTCSLPTAECLQALAASTQLTSLQLQDVTFAAESMLRAHDAKLCDAELCKMLPRMPQLVVLRLTGNKAPIIVMGSAVFEHLAAMSRLQDLACSLSAGALWESNISASDLPRLPGSLTRLQLLEYCGRDWPPLQHLKSLVELQLQNCMPLSTSVLTSVPHLQHLRMEDCGLSPDDPQSALALMRVLQQLTQLRSLELVAAGLSALAELPGQRSAIAALTASSHLTRLVVETGVEEFEQPLPRGCVQFLFPADRQLPQLKVLRLAREADGDCGSDDDDEDDVDEADVGAQALSPWCIAPGELSRIISCCPQLQDLSLTNVLHASTDVSPLLQLADSCHTLAVGGKAFGDAAVAVVTQLRRLHDLKWSDAPGFTDAGLLQLTALSGFDALRVSCCGMGKQLCLMVVEDEAALFEMELESDERKGPVYKQLRDICMCSPVLVRAHMQQEEAAREALQSENARLQQLVGQLQGQLAKSQARLAESEAKVQRLLLRRRGA